MIEMYDQNPAQKRSTRQEVWDDVTTISAQARHGMIYGHFQRIRQPGYETRFYIFENRENSLPLPTKALVSLRAGLIVENDVLLLPILAMVDHRLYEAWLDFHRSSTRLCFADLMHQESINLSIYNENAWHRFQTPNELRDLAEYAMLKTCHMPAWSAATFHKARKAIYRRYPTSEAIWLAITSDLLTAQGSDSVPRLPG